MKDNFKSLYAHRQHIHRVIDMINLEFISEFKWIFIDIFNYSFKFNTDSSALICTYFLLVQIRIKNIEIKS